MTADKFSALHRCRRRFTEPYIALKELAAGGVLKFVLADTPADRSPVPEWL